MDITAPADEDWVFLLAILYGLISWRCLLYETDAVVLNKCCNTDIRPGANGASNTHSLFTATYWNRDGAVVVVPQFVLGATILKLSLSQGK